MASSRLLYLVFSPSSSSAAVNTMARGSFRRGMHVVAASATSPESQRLLQFKLESILSVVGGEMVVKDMRFTRDGFDYWRHAAIPSSSVVKELVSTWANVDSSGSNNNSFKFYADKTLGRKIEEFLQRMVADVEQKFTKEEFNPLEGRRLDVQLADKQEYMAKEESSDSKKALNGGLGEQESIVQKHDNFEANEANDSLDTQIVGEQEMLAKEGKSEAEEGLHKRLNLHDSMPEEKESECKQAFNKRSVVQLSDKQDPLAKVENFDVNLERLIVQDFARKEEKFEAIQVQSENEQDIMSRQAHVIEAQREEAKIEPGTIGREETFSMADGQNTSEKEGISLTGYSLKKRESAELKHAKARKQAPNEQGIMATSLGSMAPIKKTLGDTCRLKNKEGAELQNAEEEEQNHGFVKDPFQQQTDNIVRKTSRMGRKIVYTYYSKSSPRRVSL